jgi:hypothetical protein
MRVGKDTYPPFQLPTSGVWSRTMKQFKIAVLLASLTMSCYASDWKTGTVKIHPITLGKSLPPGPNDWVDPNTGYVVTPSGDPLHVGAYVWMPEQMISSPGGAEVVLQDGATFIVPNYGVGGSQESTLLSINDDVECSTLGAPAYGSKSWQTPGYYCSLFKRIVLKHDGSPHLLDHERTFTFEYKLGKKYPNGQQEIKIRGVGKGSYTSHEVKPANPPSNLPSSGAVASRKQFATTVLESIKNPLPGFNITAEGPDANLYVLHLPGMTYAMCQGVFTTGPVSELRKAGFTHYVCTDDGQTTFTTRIPSQ